MKKSSRIYPEHEPHCYAVKVCGIPCHALVTDYHEGWDGNYWEPPEYAEVEFELYDRKGYRAGWLEAKMSDDERVDLEVHLIKLIES